MMSYTNDWNTDVVAHVSVGAGGLGLISTVVYF